MNQDVGYCPQFDALDDQLTGLEMLRFYAKLRGIAKDKIEEVRRCRAFELLYKILSVWRSLPPDHSLENKEVASFHWRGKVGKGRPFLLGDLSGLFLWNRVKFVKLPIFWTFWSKKGGSRPTPTPPRALLWLRAWGALGQFLPTALQQWRSQGVHRGVHWAHTHPNSFILTNAFYETKPHRELATPPAPGPPPTRLAPGSWIRHCTVNSCGHTTCMAYLFFNLQQVCAEAILHFDLTLHAKKTLKQYSIGNKRKLSMAIALLGNPQLVLLVCDSKYNYFSKSCYFLEAKRK